MGRNFLRKCTLSLSGSSSGAINGGGDTDLRIQFSIKQWHAGSPNMGSFRIYNPSSQTVRKFQNKEFSKVEFSAGYEDNCGVIFSGDIKQTIYGHENAVDSYIDVFAADGQQGYQTANVTASRAAGWTPADKVKIATDALAPYGITMGVNALDLSTPAYPRGRAFIGMARDLIRQVVLSAGGMWSIQQGKVMITPKSLDTGSGAGAIKLTASTGLVGYPQQTEDGIRTLSLINPSLQPLMKIQLDPSQIIAAQQDNNPFSGGDASERNNILNLQNLGSGTYTIFHMDRYGDTRGGDWYDECISIGVGGNVSPNAKAQHYYVNPQ